MKKHRKLGNWHSRSSRIVALGTLAVTAIAGYAPTALALSSPKPAQQDAAPATVFNIGEGSLQSVLDQFKKATGVSIAFHLPPETVGGFHSRGVKGAYSTEAALKQILDGTGLGYHAERNGTRYEIQIQNTEQVSVTTSLNSVSLGQFTEGLTDTPQTVNIVPQYIMQEQQVTSLHDSLKNVPGIALAAGEGGQQGDNLTIRGFSARNDIYLDGIRDFGSYFRDSFDFESVDVLQGPASVEFGRGSTGGVVNQESKQPVSNRLIRPGLQFGTNGMRRGTLDVNLPLARWIPASAFRINAVGMESGVAERNITTVRRVGVAPALMFGLGRPTRVILQYLHEFEDTTPDYGVTWFGVNVAPVPRQNWYGLRNFNRMTITPDVLTGRVEQDLGSHFNLRTSVRYGHYPRNINVTEAIVNAAGTVANVGTPLNPTSKGKYYLYSGYTATCAVGTTVTTNSCFAFNTPVNQTYARRNLITRYSVEDMLWGRTELTSHFSVHGIENNAVMLVEGGRERSNPATFTLYQADGTTAYPTSFANLQNPNPDDTAPGVAVQGLATRVNSQSYGVNLLDTIRPFRFLTISGGVRFDYFNTNSVTPTTVGAVTTLAQVARLDKVPTYRAAVVYKPTTNGSFYFDYGTSFNPSAESLSLSANNAVLPPESNTTYEAGVKWDLMRNRLNVNGSYFTTTKLNAKETNPFNSQQTILAGNQRVQGVQIGGLGHLPNRFDLIFGYAYLDSRVLSSIVNISPFAAINAVFYNEWQERLASNAAATPDARYNTAPYYLSPVGLPLTNVAKNSGNIWVTHALLFGFSGGFGGNYLGARRSASTAVNAVYLNSAANDVRTVPFAFRAVPGYTSLNAMLSRSINEHLSVQANFNNLTNKFYIDAPASNRLIPGEGFNTQFGLTTRF